MSSETDTERRHCGAAVVVEPVRVDAPVEGIIAAFCAGRDPAILETTLPPAGGGGFSIFACDPVDEFVQAAADPACPFGRFAARAARYPRVDSTVAGWPFMGGWIGYFTYEAGLAVEKLTTRKQRDRLLPAAHWCLYDAAAIYDHAAKQWYAAAMEWGGSASFPSEPAGERLRRVQRRLADAGQWPSGWLSGTPRGQVTALSLSCAGAEILAGERSPRLDGGGTDGRGSEQDGCRLEVGNAHPTSLEVGGAHPTSSEVGGAHPTYEEAFAKAMGYIEAGDIYQVNLTQRFTVETRATPLENYLRLRAISPSPYAAFLPWEEGAIISASPELFLELRHGHVVTRPIKGTRGRGVTDAEDAARKAELQGSEKDRAELNMIIDLLRNDLGRVSRYGTVRVKDAGSMETHPTVFHRVATVEGELREGRDWGALLRAAFPGGSVTGCPKIRALQIIDEGEPHPREVYCGAIGMIGLDGSMTLNLAIRTMLQRGQTVQVYAGGAVVADSTAEGEYREIETKAMGMLRALGAE